MSIYPQNLINLNKLFTIHTLHIFLYSLLIFMLIGIDASRANRPAKTGVEWYSYHLIQELKKIDQKNQYLLYTNLPLGDKLAKCPDNFQQALLKWPPVRFWTLIRLSYEMKFGQHKPDLLFVPAHTIPLLNPKKVIVTVHDIGFERFPELYNWADKLYHKWTIRFIKKHAIKIITVSEFSKKEIMDVYKIPAEKIEVVYNGFSSDVYKDMHLDKDSARSLLLEKYQIDAPYFMFTGRLEAKKNFERLVKAFLKFKAKNPQSKYKLVLVGKKGNGFEEVMMKLSLEQEDSDIIYLKYLSSEENAFLLNNAELFIFPSLYEGFGIPVLEAMSCGCPVVCSNTTSLPEVAGEAAIKFNPENIDLIEKAMETVVFNPEVRQALIEKGFEQSKKFSWEQCATDTLKIFENV